MKINCLTVRNSCAVGIFCALSGISSVPHAQDVKRCDGAGGKVTYAEVCPAGTASSTMTTKGVSVTDSDKRQREAEAAFQKRHAARERLSASERSANRRAALAERRANLDEEKMRRTLALKEDAAKRGERKVRVPKKAKSKKQKA